jgi:hypothetical protein
MLAEGCPESRLERADINGTSSTLGDYWWKSNGMVAERRGWLPRERLAGYAVAFTENRMQDCRDMLEPFEDGGPVNRN